MFFDDVRVPKINIVGAENKGWQVAKYLLEFERGGSTGGNAARKVARSGCESWPNPLHWMAVQWRRIHPLSAA